MRSAAVIRGRNSTWCRLYIFPGDIICLRFQLVWLVLLIATAINSKSSTRLVVLPNFWYSARRQNGNVHTTEGLQL